MNQLPFFDKPTPDRQRGAALLVFMLIFFMASMSWLLSQADALHLRGRADQATNLALAQAKEALVGRATTDSNRPGSLPCPDVDDDGKADGNFGFCSASIARLPWKTLDLPDLRDGEGNRLWYALADELRDNDDAPPINPTLTLLLSLDGASNIAAIVFSAGPPLAGQDGRPSNDIDDYLDGANQDGSPYVSGSVSPTFNDKAIAISRDQLFKIVNRTVLSLLGADLNRYYEDNGNLYPASVPDLKTSLESLTLTPATEQEALTKRIEMFNDNGWFAIATYTPASDRKSVTLITPPSPTPPVPPDPTSTTCTIALAQRPVCKQP